MKGLSGRGYKGGDDLAITVERELAFNTPRDCYIITLQSIKTLVQSLTPEPRGSCVMVLYQMR